MRTTRSARPFVGLSLLAAGSVALVVAGGCSRTDRYRMNPTPELDTLSQRPDDIKNRLTVTSDEDFRMLNEDLGRFFLLDRPSRLSPQVIPY